MMTIDPPELAKRRFRTFALIGAGVALALVVFRDDSLALVNALLAVAIMAVAALPTFLRVLTPEAQRAPFPFMECTGAFYGIFFGLSAFLGFVLTVPGPDSASQISIYQQWLDAVDTEAQLLALAGLTALLGVWWVTRAKLMPRWLRLRLPAVSSADRLTYLSWLLLIGAIAYQVFPQVRAVPSIGQFLQPAGFVGFAVSAVIFCRGEMKPWHRGVFLFVLLPVWVLMAVRAGFVTPVIVIGLIWFAVDTERRRVILWAMAGVVACAIIAYPAIQAVRAKVWVPIEYRYLEDGSEGSTEKADREGSLLILPEFDLPFRHGFDIYGSSGSTFNTWGGLVKRMSHIMPFSVVTTRTPDDVPYWQGHTYRTLFISWVPRMLWRDKPVESYGSEFGRRYGLIAPNNFEMSLNIPWIIEAYANFGRWGVLVGMAAIGLFLGFIDRFFNAPECRPSELALGAAILAPLVIQESNFTLMTGSLIPFTICIWIYFYVGLRWLPWRE